MKRSMGYPTWLRNLARGATVLYAGAVMALSLMPGNDVPLGNVSDKYRHAAAYAVFALLLSVSFLGRRWWPIFAAFVVVSGFGLMVEYIQPSFHRSFDYGDALANSIGAALGCGFLLIIRLMLSRRAAPATISA